MYAICMELGSTAGSCSASRACSLNAGARRPGLDGEDATAIATDLAANLALEAAFMAVRAILSSPRSDDD